MLKSSYFTFIDLFAGIGGFHIALSNLGGKCVSAVEFDKNCRETYKENFYGDTPELFDNGLFFEDITKTNEKDIPKHTILCGGFPCQPFSIGGYQKGFADHRGNLFFDILRIIQEKEPEVIFLENVKNLVSHDKGNTFKVIFDALEQEGYFIKYKVLNTSLYSNLPQNRERIYIVGFKDKNAYENFDFPEIVNHKHNIINFFDKNVSEKYDYKKYPKIYPILKDLIKNENTVYQWRRHYVRENKKGVCPTLTANMGTGGHNVPLIKQNDIIRKLTPKECLRLQGFPEDYKIPEQHKSRDNIIYKQAGNSVSIPVLESIAKNILKALKKYK